MSKLATYFSRECPQPAIAQLENLCERYGSDNVGQTVLDIPEMGYPFTWIVLLNDQYCPWWEVIANG